MGDNDSGSKPPEYWHLALREIIDRALERERQHMCNLINSANPELVEISKGQHVDTMNKIDELIKQLSAATRLLYLVVAVMGGVGVVVLGAMLFVVFFLGR